ncbi:FdhF/YdeP family oxidoreductase [Nocardioides limicola]|uniref:FdhF/YdeP family oxidoreductase n=1 Tax=Nocardioides limicola TaxID=2803368 RepID=UPI00193B9DF3|nr:FdhF/YdeP family oxidoreductase [Nocardioides sp. DJM-14]
MSGDDQRLLGSADESDLTITGPGDHAAGLPAVTVAMRRALKEMGPVRTARTLLRVNQPEGFDCMSCAWPDPDPEHRHRAEFCENGAKAVAEEGTKARVTPEFFAEHSVGDLLQQTDHWLGKQGRLTHPMVKWPGSEHYEPISWDAALQVVGDHLQRLGSADEAVFYTSGRASNEAAFAYQLFAREFGTNNLPDCSNMCHESSGVALIDTIGIGKGSVSLEDLYSADLIVLAGQNPGTNHPRMLSALEIAKRRGARIISINPLREAGLVNFRNPQYPRGIVGRGTDLTDLHLQVRLNGDLALFQAIGALLVEWDAIDHSFVDAHTQGFGEWRDHVAGVDWEQVEAVTGLDREQITEAARMIADSQATIYCWAMGLTQHRNAVATIKEVVNLALARGDIGKPGAGLCPVRGHSNVQGDRTMGIWEKPPPEFLDALAAAYGFEPPREHGHDTVECIHAMLEGKASVFVALGGNFLHAAPDTALTAEALQRTALTVQISTKLNRSHLITGRTALILPTLGRTERDEQASGPQFVTVEDSMSVVHASRGRLDPASAHLRSEVAIVTGIAEAALGPASVVNWRELRADYRLIRAGIERVVPGFEDFEARVVQRSGFVLPHPPRDSRTFVTGSGRAHFTASPIEPLQVPPGHLVLQTLRSHDQFNTTVYGLSDRYRGIEGGRLVVMVNRRDLAAMGLRAGDLVDIVACWDDARERRVRDFRVVEYDTPVGTAAAYYPETNPLVPLDSTAEESNTPTSKSVLVRLERSAAGDQ